MQPTATEEDLAFFDLQMQHIVDSDPAIRAAIEDGPEEPDEDLLRELTRRSRARLASFTDPEHRARAARLEEYFTLLGVTMLLEEARAEIAAAQE